jgi:outer membrane protein TolC
VDAFGIPQSDGSVRILFPDIPDNYQAKAEVGMPLYTAGRVGALVDSARSSEQAAVADRQAAEQDLRLEIASAYWTLVTARESIRVLETSQARMDAYVSDVKARVDSGVLPPNDVLTAQAQRARQSVQLIQARNAAAYAQADLARLIGADLTQPITLVTPVDQPIAGSSDAAGQPLDALLARALKGRAERDSLRARQAAFTASGAAALANLRPSVGAYASVQPARPNQLFVPRSDTLRTSWNLGVNVTWSLFDGGKAHADQAAASAEADALGKRLDDFDAIVAVDLRQRLLDLESGRAALAASAEAVSAATEAHRVIQVRFAAGVATSTDVLDAQVALREAELEQMHLAVALRLAEARLLRAVGAL